MIKATTQPPATEESETADVDVGDNNLTRISALIALAIYLPSIIHPDMPAETSQAVLDAFKLSLNFAFVTPIFLPALAPVYSPVYEAIFNLVIFWFTLFLGFVSEDINPESRRVPYAPFAIGGLFLTNVFYLPYLILRKPNPHPVSPVSPVSSNLLLRYGESRSLPLKMAALGVISLVWGVYARPDLLSMGLQVRFASIPGLISHSVLAKAMLIDTIPLSLFQSALVNDDVKRRNWVGPEKDRAVFAARFVPFFGLCFYLWQRANLASLIEKKEKKNI